MFNTCTSSYTGSLVYLADLEFSSGSVIGNFSEFSSTNCQQHLYIMISIHGLHGLEASQVNDPVHCRFFYQRRQAELKRRRCV